MTELRITAMAHGGDGVARLEGKAVFVPGTIPGDVIEVEIVDDRRRFARGRLARLVEPSPDRIEPRCPHFELCGGCTWQYVPVEVQRRWKEETVSSQLAHIGRFESPDVKPIEGSGDGFAYRNRMDFRTKAGRPTLYEARSHDAVRLDVCHLLAPPLENLFDLLEGVDVPGRLTLRAGLRTGETVVIVDDDLGASGLRERGLPAASEVDAIIHEVVDGRRFRITGRAFFQVNTEGAERMIEIVRDAAGDVAGGHVLDAYAGGGLLAAAVSAQASRLTLIEADPVASSDLRANLGEDVELITDDVESGLDLVSGTPDVIIVDPPRAGLGAAVVGRLIALASPTIVSVACDPASFARDARMLVDGGYRLEWVVPLDLFPQTPHVETVARFVRG